MEMNNITTDATQTYEAFNRNDTSVTVKVFYVIIALLGVTGNGLVLYVFFKLPKLRVVPNLLISHQSLVDLIVSFLLFVSFVFPTTNVQSLNTNHHAFANFLCKCFISQFVFWASMRASTTNLVFLTLERYLAVVHPHLYRQRLSVKTAIFVCILAWCVGALSILSSMIVYSVNERGQCSNDHLKDSGRVVIALVGFTITLVIPLVVMVFVYSSIIRAFRASKEWSSKEQEVSTDSDNSATVTEANASQTRSQNVYTVDVSKPRAERSEQLQTDGGRTTRNIFVTMFVICVTYLICWTPNQILYLHHNLVRQRDWTGPLHRFVILLAASNVCVNPIIYAFKYRSFRKGLKQLFPKYVPSSF
ncbi:Cholecystokinin receptor type A [Holothuria leucospilota]|uniref:Cholecystokinin receptor type A n=1 Tax=Holothuria leucospilota TaxID=206669 RepID=A0A9Q1HEG6_HOLLE|nr:Cholecystokinin receptor type A [Holothuria leucospilota]